MQSIFRADFNAAAAVEAVPRRDAAGLSQLFKADNLLLRADFETVSTPCAMLINKSNLNDWARRGSSGEGPKGTKWAEMSAPTIFHKSEFKCKDSEHCGQRGQPCAENDVTPEKCLRTHCFEGC